MFYKGLMNIDHLNLHDKIVELLSKFAEFEQR